MVPFSDKESTLLQTAFANLQGGEAALMKMVRHFLIAAYGSRFINIVAFSAADCWTD